MADWNSCKRLLCIRADNMGDVLMTTPALRALKDTFQAHLTLLTSNMGKIIAPYIPEVDEVIVFDLPWVKTNDRNGSDTILSLVALLKEKQFDGAIIFTVYSQNPLPAAMIVYMAGIERVLGYCRENPYHLLSDWVVDKEPYSFIQHQVERDLALVASIGATTSSLQLSIRYSNKAKEHVLQSLSTMGIKTPFLIFHPGVSEPKREYPQDHWRQLVQRANQEGYTVLLTGTVSESSLCEQIIAGMEAQVYNLAGKFSIEQFIALLDLSDMVVSVNTGTVHIASALQRPIVVLYAMTNPQHTPWATPNKVYHYSIDSSLKSKNQVIDFVDQHYYHSDVRLPTPGEIMEGVKELLNEKNG